MTLMRATKIQHIAAEVILNYSWRSIKTDLVATLLNATFCTDRVPKIFQILPCTTTVFETLTRERLKYKGGLKVE